jgi:hypothetical protein
MSPSEPPDAPFTATPQILVEDAAAFLPIAEKHRIALSQDPSAAMKASRAYEERVFRSE